MKGTHVFCLSGGQVFVTNLLFFILFSIVPVYLGNYCRRTLSQEFNAAENRMLEQAAFWSGRVGTLVGCVSLCHSWQACKSVNYFKNNCRCDLNNVTRIDVPNNFVADYASVYFDGTGDTPEFSVAAYSDCQSLLKAGYNASGIYTIFPARFADGLRVYCDMETDGGGWLVFQRRQDGSVDFDRGWADYRVGFGDLAGEFWLGNDILRALSDFPKAWDLRIDLEARDGSTGWAEYGVFQISGQEYLLSIGSYNGMSTAVDSLDVHNRPPFSTKDMDNVGSSSECSEELKLKGGWWYSLCSNVNLNGMYFKLSWDHQPWEDDESFTPGSFSFLKGCSMKIRLAM